MHKHTGGPAPVLPNVMPCAPALWAFPFPREARRIGKPSIDALDLEAAPKMARSSRLGHLQAEFGDHGVAHDEFLRLAGHRHRQAVLEADIERYLVVGDLALAVGLDLFFGGALAGGQNDPGGQRLAELFVGHAEYLYFLYLRVPVEEFLDLARIDVFTAANDHVLYPPDDVAIALVVKRGEVAGVHPAFPIDRLAGLFLVLPIALHHRIAARAQLSGFTDADRQPIRADDLDFDMRLDAANGRDALFERIVTVALERYRAGFGHAVGDGHLRHMHQRYDLLHHLDRTGRTGHDAGAQAGEVEGRKIRMVE